MKYTYYKGIIAESFAKMFLRLKFYKILKSRDKSHLGEIDIVARRGNTIIKGYRKFV